MLPSDAQERKEIPIATGVIDYFPDAIAAVAELSRIGNEQHNPGKPLHWDRSKSQDEADALMRHFVERGTIDTDGQRHSAKVAWRALANLQKEIENDRERKLSNSTERCDTNARHESRGNGDCIATSNSGSGKDSSSCAGACGRRCESGAVCPSNAAALRRSILCEGSSGSEDKKGQVRDTSYHSPLLGIGEPVVVNERGFGQIVDVDNQNPEDVVYKVRFYKHNEQFEYLWVNADDLRIAGD